MFRTENPNNKIRSAIFHHLLTTWYGFLSLLILVLIFAVAFSVFKPFWNCQYRFVSELFRHRLDSWMPKPTCIAWLRKKENEQYFILFAMSVHQMYACMYVVKNVIMCPRVFLIRKSVLRFEIPKSKWSRFFSFLFWSFKRKINYNNNIIISEF